MNRLDRSDWRHAEGKSNKRSCLLVLERGGGSSLPSGTSRIQRRRDGVASDDKHGICSDLCTAHGVSNMAD